MWRDDANLLDMLIWARRASEYVRERTDAEFATDVLVQDATIRCVEVVGEAASRVSAEFRETHPAIPWAQIIGMRNRLAHEYGHIDLAEVWQAARADCPKLATQLEPLVPRGNPALPAEWEFL